ncbi:leupaxin-like [Lycorma delicatula]|uniref:leupaxin-like n=1 Tax=Lycorma delicatula TaxID=130591 RepID=UPI003F50E13D
MQQVKDANSSNQTSIKKRTSSTASPPKHHGENNRPKELQAKLSSDSNENLKSRSSKSNSSNEFVCRACEQPIKGLIVKALGETWHQEHFLCSECKKPITSNKFNVEQGKPYCEDDYADLFLKKCQGCKAPIRDVVVIALNQTWHKDHFVCIMCGTKLANKGFFERENNPFCHQCFEENFCPKCNECNAAITDTAIVALGKKWHQECFKCSNCQKPILESTFEVVSSRPICSNCSNLASEL